MGGVELTYYQIETTTTYLAGYQGGTTDQPNDRPTAGEQKEEKTMLDNKPRQSDGQGALFGLVVVRYPTQILW